MNEFGPRFESKEVKDELSLLGQLIIKNLNDLMGITPVNLIFHTIETSNLTTLSVSVSIEYSINDGEFRVSLDARLMAIERDTSSGIVCRLVKSEEFEIGNDRAQIIATFVVLKK